MSGNLDAYASTFPEVYASTFPEALTSQAKETIAFLIRVYF
jgi:hypothetical protein